MRNLVLISILIINGCASNYHKFSEIRGLENSVDVHLMQNNIERK